ncbi:hypothetical protein CDL15_Pgr026399 [Punica granatum]|uniref:Uncharacterized protein n=1 Tax=Punica granatum TaxID=22663 RepID=A0A218XNF1_PUNGR|nr:hypothetical protein CDL15_Pgr026399 [Punica granatum]PKI75065.1 hypothetical protein CRG98_004539 [Punica granatum]
MHLQGQVEQLLSLPRSPLQVDAAKPSVTKSTDAAIMSIANSTTQEGSTKLQFSAAEEHTRSATLSPQSQTKVSYPSHLTEYLSPPSFQLLPGVEALDRQEDDYVECEVLPHEEAKQSPDQEPLRNNLEDVIIADSEVGMTEVLTHEFTLGIPS